MHELIRIFVSNMLAEMGLPQMCLLHPKASGFACLVDEVTAKMQLENDKDKI